uniref:Uncharacterized protein n=1 Tax=Cucumis melo TaxID=3656 RepID=A0A9I9E8K0_CUCME
MININNLKVKKGKKKSCHQVGLVSRLNRGILSRELLAATQNLGYWEVKKFLSSSSFISEGFRSDNLSGLDFYTEIVWFSFVVTTLNLARNLGVSALFNFHSFLTVILLGICTCTYVKMHFPAILEQRNGFRGFFWKAARIVIIDQQAVIVHISIYIHKNHSQKFQKVHKSLSGDCIVECQSTSILAYSLGLKLQNKILQISLLRYTQYCVEEAYWLKA